MLLDKLRLYQEVLFMNVVNVKSEVENNFSYSRTVRVAALSTVLLGILFLISQLACVSLLYGSLSFSIGIGTINMPLPVVASYITGLFVFAMLWEFFRCLKKSNPNFRWPIHPFLQIFGTSAILATFAFFFGQYLFDKSHEGVFASPISNGVGMAISVALLFSWIMGMIVFVLLLEAMNDLEKQTVKK